MPVIFKVINRPPAPIATSGTEIEPNSFYANWEAAERAVGYTLDVATDSEFTSFVSGYEDLDVENVLTWLVDSNISAGNVYYYRVRAYNNGGSSTNSNTIAITTTLLAPLATDATNLAADSFSANWNASIGATGYRLDVATDSEFTEFVSGYEDLNVNNVLTFSVDSNISAGTTYYYRVRAYNIDTTSTDSNTISLLTVPAAPVATAATNIESDSFSANWNSSTGAAGYRLDVALDNGFSSFVSGYNNLNVNNVVTYSVDSNIDPDTDYYYRVRAYNTGGTSTNSNTISLTTPIVVPTGLIIPYTAGAGGAPSGWSLFTSANGKYIIGAGSTYAVGANGAGDGSHQAAVPANVAHVGTNGTESAAYYGPGSTQGTGSAGAHPHTTSSYTYTPPYQQCYLIKANAGNTQLPTNGVIFSSDGDPLGSLNNIWTGGKMFKANSGISTGGSNSITGVSTDSQGNHMHGTGWYAMPYCCNDNTITTGGHSHSNITLTVSNALKQVALSAWQHASANFDLAGGMIGMYESLTPPDGWYLCNGSNGTPDLRNYFIKNVTDGSEDSGTGNGTVTVTSSSLSHGVHNHAGSVGNGSSGTRIGHTNNVTMPAHTGINDNYTWLPPYYALAFIMYGG